MRAPVFLYCAVCRRRIKGQLMTHMRGVHPLIAELTKRLTEKHHARYQ